MSADSPCGRFRGQRPYRNLLGIAIMATGFNACREIDSPSDPVRPNELALTPGTWTTLAATYPVGVPMTLQLLMDGSVLANDSIDPKSWHRLIPSAIGGYANGMWFPAASSETGRVYFATGMLRDGRYVIGGGEYVDISVCATDAECASRFGAGHTCHTSNHICYAPSGLADGRNKCEIYDPTVNYPAGQWLALPDLPGLDVVDGIAAPLPNGKLLFGPGLAAGGVFNTQSIEFDPANLAAPWDTVLHATGGPAFAEGSMTLMQTGDILVSEDGVALYSSSSHSWTNIPAPPGYNSPYVGEGGPAMTLYDGTVMLTGSSGFNGKYSPSTNTLTNIAPPPGGGRLDENDLVVLPTGNVLCAVLDQAQQQPYTFYEYSPTANTFTSVMTGAPSSLKGIILQTPLPDGTVLVGNNNTSTLYIYHPQGPQLTSFGQPSITNVTGPVAGVYTLTGTTLNGLTNGANRDDEQQNYTSFPIIAVTTPGETEYVRVTSVSTASIAPGAAATVKFTLPSDAPHGVVQLSLSASGLFSSNSWPLTNGVALAGPGQQLVALLN
jgi:hypothetical protein